MKFSHHTQLKLIQLETERKWRKNNKNLRRADLLLQNQVLGEMKDILQLDVLRRRPVEEYFCRKIKNFEGKI